MAVCRTGGSRSGSPDCGDERDMAQVAAAARQDTTGDMTTGQPPTRFWQTVGLILVLSIVGLTYEIAAGRVLAPFFGTSLVTWTTVIAVVLAGFSLGSALGGLIAERVSIAE